MAADNGDREDRGSRAWGDKAKSFGYSYLVRSIPPTQVHDSIVQWLVDQGSTVQRDEADSIIAVHRDPWAWGLGRWRSSKLISISLRGAGEGTMVRAIIRTSHHRRTNNREERRDYDEWLAYGLLMGGLISHVDDRSYLADRHLLELAVEQKDADIGDGRAIMATCCISLLLSSLLAYQVVTASSWHRSTQAALTAIICEIVIIASLGLFIWGWMFYTDGARIRRYLAENDRALDHFVPS
jgi:hypothetical protein